MLGSIRIGGFSLGVAGVLFVGILLGHFQPGLNHEILDFAREFGLILFVFTIGLQVGPGFFASLKRQGLPLNALAAGIVILGALLTVAAALSGLAPAAAAVGIFAGATTNTPALGAARQALQALGALPGEQLELPALGYAVSYPFGVVGIVLAIVLVRIVFRIRIPDEAEAFAARQASHAAKLQRLNLEVTNPNLVGLKLSEIPGARGLEVVVSRIRRAGEEQVRGAQPGITLQIGDILLAVGAPANLEQFRLIVGQESAVDLMKAPGRVSFERVVVTDHNVLGKSLPELGIETLFGVTVTRVTRGDLEMSAIHDLTLQFGDILQIVGEKDDIKKAAALLGNSLRELNHTRLIPIFVGVALGLLAGSAPFHIPSMPAALKLGLAGGPLIVAILLGRIGRIGPLVWYMPVSASIAFRELGIALFLACVGIKAGEQFLATLTGGAGLIWMACGAVITLLPLLIAGWIARAWMKLNYMDVCGLLSGSMTDPPALAFANAAAGSDAPSVSYATVYPMTMLLRVIAAQVLALWLAG